MEEWKDIHEFEGLYQISNCGKVQRTNYEDIANAAKYKLPFTLKPRIDKDGYLKITLSKCGKYKQFFVHRLVALHFIDNPNNKKEVNHIDGIKGNPYYKNLEWVTQSENRQHCLKYLNPKLRNNKSSKKVFQYDLNGQFIKEYPSAKEASRENGFSQGHISEVCRGEMKKYKGYVWRYCK